MDVDDGQEKDDTITSYCINQPKAIGKLTFDMSDATAAMKLVREHEWMFGSANASKIRQSLSRSSESVFRHSHASQASKPKYDFQEHMYIEYYDPQSLWDLQTCDRPMQEKLKGVANFIVNTAGLHSPRS